MRHFCSVPRILSSGRFLFAEVVYLQEKDQEYMRRALALAARGAGRVCPNPMVGCVIVRDGRVIGEGWHEHCGGLHAERNALKKCAEDPAGADLYVTLEPCCHWGRTPPCTDAILERKIGRVFVGCLDPNPLVAGKGAQILRDAGIPVETGVCEEECRRLNEVFFHYITHKTPFVVLKYAMTLDGKIAARTGDSRWVTGEAARLHVHETRNRLTGIMAGVGTVLADDPCSPAAWRAATRCASSATATRAPRWAAGSSLGAPCADVHRRHSQNDRAAALAGGRHPAVRGGRAGPRLPPDLMRSSAPAAGQHPARGRRGARVLRARGGIVRKVQAYIAPKLIGGADAKTPVGGAGFAAWRTRAAHRPDRHPAGRGFLLEGDLPCSPASSKK